jgi:hypothetical protein
MTFITGTITNANPGPALYTVIETAALAIGWTLEDTVTIGSNTHKVLKSAAAGNSQSLDWYLDINYPTTGVTGGIRFAPFEGYTAASDVALRGPVSANATTIDATTYSRYGASTSALETNWTNGVTYTSLSAVMTTTIFTYWISITRNRIIVMLSSDSSGVYYTGFFNPTTAHATEAGASLFPLVMSKAAIATPLASSSTSAAQASLVFTRLPKFTTLTGTGWGASAVLVGNFGAVEGVAGGAAAPSTARVTLTAPSVMMGAASFGIGQAGASKVGTLEDLAIAAAAPTVVRGDTLTVGSDTWYSSPYTSGYSIFFKGI